MTFNTIPMPQLQEAALKSGIPQHYIFDTIQTQLDLIEGILMRTSSGDLEPDHEYTLSLEDNIITIKSDTWEEITHIYQPEIIDD